MDKKPNIREMKYEELALILTRFQIALETGADFEKDIDCFIRGEAWRRDLYIEE